MKTFLKIILVAALLIIALKLSPVLFIAAVIGLLAVAVLGVVGISLVVGLLGVLVAIVAALAPIWIPVLLVMGAISLFKKPGDRPAGPSTPAIAA